MDKVVIKSTVKSRVGVIVPQIPFQHEWMGEGASYKVDYEILEQLMYDPGFKYMIDTGMLYIEDMEVKKELDIEPQDATEPVNVIVLTDKERRKYLINLSLDEFKEKIKKLSLEQIEQLVDYAIENRLVDLAKDNILKEICGRDIVTAIRLGDANKEE